MGQVLPFTSTESVDEAWSAYRDHTAQAFGNPRLWLDREWMQTRTKLLRRFERLYLAGGAA
jgi:hypothetical protein